MSLQGSFETIALSDVMALLAASCKSGELRVVGEHVEGRLWLKDGRVVASKVGKAQGHVDALFELMRLKEGNFVFKDGAEAAEPGEAEPVEPLVREAEERLKEWQDIAQVVPSAEHRVRLIPDLPTPEVTLSADEWHLVMAIALAGTVQGVLEEVALGQFDGFRGIRRLVDTGLVLVEPPRARPAAAAHRPARRQTPLSAAGLASSPVANPALAASLSEALAAVHQPEAPQAANPVLAASLSAALAAVPEPAAPRLSALLQAQAPAPEPAQEFLGYEDYPDDGEEQAQGGVVHHFPIPEPDESLPYAVGNAPPAPYTGPTFDPSPADALRGRRARRQASSARAEEFGGPEAPPLRPAETVETDAGHQVNGHPDSEAINRGLLLKFLSSVRS